MLRFVVIGVQRTLNLQAGFAIMKLPNYARTAQQCLMLHIDRSAHEEKINISISPATEPMFGDAEGDYITEYSAKDELQSSRKLLIKTMRTYYNLSKDETNSICSHELLKCNFKERKLLFNVSLLYKEGVNKRSFLDYPWMISLPNKSLVEKIKVIRSMHIRDINDFVAFLRLSLRRLTSLVEFMNRESAIIPYSNRVYYISKKLDLEPYVVSKYLSNRLFIIHMPFNHLERNLQHMINYNIAPISLLKDLWAFRYRPISVQKRLERVSAAKKEKVMPWMVRCPEPILERSLKLSRDELEVLGEKGTALEYVAERLQFSVEETKAIMMKHPLAFTVRATKIKEVLDYMLGEAGFTRYDIAQVPRILCHSLETTKQRLEELKSNGCRPSSLVILCRSKREYQKFLNAWISKQNDRTNDTKPEDLQKDNVTSGE